MSIMDHETKYQTNHQFRRLPKGERRVRFADSMGMELASVFLIDLINNYYFASIHKQAIVASSNNNNNNTTKEQTTTTTATHQTNHNHLHHQLHHQQPPTKPNIFNSTAAAAVRTAAAAALRTSTILGQTTTTATCLGQSQNDYHSHQQQLQHQKKLQEQQQLLRQQQLQQKLQQQQHQQQQHQQQQQQLQQQQQQQQQLEQLLPRYVCEFTQPISLISFKERVKLNKVHLETCSINSRAGNISISCTIRVLNQSYDKTVIVRYTTDEWHTHTDTLASYVPGSCDGWSDKFTSTFSVTSQVRQFQAGQRIIFAVKIVYDGDKVFWDNNGGLNYMIKKA